MKLQMVRERHHRAGDTNIKVQFNERNDHAIHANFTGIDIHYLGVVQRHTMQKY